MMAKSYGLLCFGILLLYGQNISGTVHHFNQGVDEFFYLCPDLEPDCYCFGSGDDEVRAECYGEFLSYIPAGNFLNILYYVIT